MGGRERVTLARLSLSLSSLKEKKGYRTRRTAQRPGGHYTAEPEGGYPGSDRVTKAAPSSLPKNGETTGNWRCPAIICQFPFPLSLSLTCRSIAPAPTAAVSQGITI
jgi:hypothetical protein